MTEFHEILTLNKNKTITIFNKKFNSSIRYFCAAYLMFIKSFIYSTKKNVAMV